MQSFAPIVSQDGEAGQCVDRQINKELNDNAGKL
jgi:hypothetical protein